MNCRHYKKRLLRFLMVKTAAVRAGIKPGALLRVARCYRLSRDESKGKICLYQNEILEELKLKFRILKNDPDSALVLFYDPERLAEILENAGNAAYLAVRGYEKCRRLEDYLTTLEDQCRRIPLPHEVGIFIGYPLKDVMGFIERAPRTPVVRGDWQVFGEPEESLRLMRLYRCAEQLAEKIIETYQDIETCLEQIANINIHQTVRS